MGSVVGGAMFGDNLSFISDTTIAATTTQGCKMKDKFRENFFIALPAAVLTVAILLIYAFTTSSVTEYTPAEPNLWLLVPYILVLIGGILGVNVFVVLLCGIATAVVIKLALGVAFAEIVGSMGSGASGMFEVILVTVLVTMLSGLMRHFGGFDALLHFIKRTFRGKVGGQLGIGALVSAMDIATANNTVAIVMAAPIAKNISEEYGITNTKTASLLDIFGSVVQGILPYGAQMIYAVAAITTAYSLGVIPDVVSAVEIIPYLFYPILLGVSAIIFAFVPVNFVKNTKKDK
jgi:Na+/H+ antiporter NhaC